MRIDSVHWRWVGHSRDMTKPIAIFPVSPRRSAFPNRLIGGLLGALVASATIPHASASEATIALQSGETKTHRIGVASVGLRSRIVTPDTKSSAGSELQATSRVMDWTGDHVTPARGAGIIVAIPTVPTLVIESAIKAPGIVIGKFARSKITTTDLADSLLQFDFCQELRRQLALRLDKCPKQTATSVSDSVETGVMAFDRREMIGQGFDKVVEVEVITTKFRKRSRFSSKRELQFSVAVRVQRVATNEFTSRTYIDWKSGEEGCFSSTQWLADHGKNLNRTLSRAASEIAGMAAIQLRSKVAE